MDDFPGDDVIFPALLFLSLAPAPTSTVVCEDRVGPEYYGFALAATGNIPGTGLARSRADVATPAASPFPVAVAADGSYVQTVTVSIDRMRPPRGGRLVAWVTTTELDRIELLGVLDDELRTTGSVSWNKYLVVVTLEPADAPPGATWSGPIVFRGMSRSGAMHTMIGHGALQQENCAAYGFGR